MIPLAALTLTVRALCEETISFSFRLLRPFLIHPAVGGTKGLRERTAEQGRETEMLKEMMWVKLMLCCIYLCAIIRPPNTSVACVSMM